MIFYYLYIIFTALVVLLTLYAIVTFCFPPFCFEHEHRIDKLNAVCIAIILALFAQGSYKAFKMTNDYIELMADKEVAKMQKENEEMLQSAKKNDLQKKIHQRALEKMQENNQQFSVDTTKKATFGGPEERNGQQSEHCYCQSSSISRGKNPNQ